MKVSVTTIPIEDLDVDLLLIPVTTTERDTLNLTAAFGASSARAIDDFRARAEDAVLIYPEKGKAGRVGLLGLGAREKAGLETLRRAAAAGARLAMERRVETVAIVSPPLDLEAEAVAHALVEGFMLATYRFDRYKTGEEARNFRRPERLVLQMPEGEKTGRRGADRGRIIAEAVMTARDLINTSPDEKTPTLLARAFERLAKKHGFDADVWDRALIEEEQMGGLLAVNRGSQEPPTFSVLTWHPESAVNERPVVLVGKGIVYDTGGLSLKPTKDSMDYMKSDMSGAAAVAGAMEAIARLELPVYVVGLIPATDNRPGENAYVPGDVIRMHSGKTVEVLNTDAEGRLILADALSYARTYKPELVIDVATLTGSVAVALGSECAGVFAAERDGMEERVASFLQAGERSGDRVHAFPMFDDYARALESDVADMKNVGGREGGAITAAKFLEAFTDYPWMHVDIAGVAFAHQAKNYRLKGGTGFGVRLLVEWLREFSSPRKRR
jgi:leucyl aminopeptidase